MIARTLNPTRETSCMTLMAIATFVDPLIPLTAMNPTAIENSMATPIW